MMGMVRGLIALSKREKGLDENSGAEDGGVSGVSGWLMGHVRNVSSSHISFLFAYCDDGFPASAAAKWTTPFFVGLKVWCGRRNS